MDLYHYDNRILNCRPLPKTIESGFPTNWYGRLSGKTLRHLQQSGPTLSKSKSTQDRDHVILDCIFLPWSTYDPLHDTEIPELRGAPTQLPIISADLCVLNAHIHLVCSWRLSFYGLLSSQMVTIISISRCELLLQLQGDTSASKEVPDSVDVPATLPLPSCVVCAICTPNALLLLAVTDCAHNSNQLI